MKTLPIIFRADRSGDFKGEVTAVFPTLPSDYHGRLMTCYAHIGQHGSCSLDWYHGTLPAKPAEYEALLRELRGIYETGDDAVTLRVYSAIQQRFRDEMQRTAREYRAVVKGESLFVQGRIGEAVA
jgi:hypothetical protein